MEHLFIILNDLNYSIALIILLLYKTFYLKLNLNK